MVLLWFYAPGPPIVLGARNALDALPLVGMLFLVGLVSSHIILVWVLFVGCPCSSCRAWSLVCHGLVLPTVMCLLVETCFSYCYMPSCWGIVLRLSCRSLEWGLGMHPMLHSQLDTGQG